MKKIKSSRILRCLLLVCPFIMGMIFYLHYYSQEKVLTWPIFAAFYSSLKLYTFSTDAKVVDGITKGWYILLEIARYWAVCITGSAFFRIIAPFFTDFFVRMKAERVGSITLHGTPAITEIFKKSLKNTPVISETGSHEKYEASCQIIAFEKDEEALEFVRKNQTRLLKDKKPVYLCLQDPDKKMTSHSAVNVSCISENCARLYWEKQYVKCFEKTPVKKNILIFSSGIYMREILKQGLLVNVFGSATTPLSYHVFASGKEFLTRYPGVKSFVSLNEESDSSDSLFFHEEDPHELLPSLLAQADRVILAGDSDEENYKTFSLLCRLYTKLPPVHLRLKTDKIMQALYASDGNIAPGEALFGVNFTVFGTDEEMYTRELLLEESLLSCAKTLHSWYQKHYDGTPSFERLSTLKQQSNIASADHLPVKLRLILKKDCLLNEQTQEEYRKVFEDKVKDASFVSACEELEHERWCRFHYVNGWTPGPRNDALRHHDCLVPFDDLSDEEKIKDLDSFRVLENL